jgi:transcriptional regulator with XRE-family HTH domain
MVAPSLPQPTEEIMPRKPTKDAKKPESHRIARRGKLDPQEMSIRRDFSRRLQGLMHQKGINNAELARAIDVFRGQVGEWLAGVSFPYPTNLQKLAKYFRIPVSELAPEGAYDTTKGLLRADVDMRLADDGQVWLHINKKVPLEIATQVIKLVSNG